jgi:outer membrane protein assembly factor BamB
VAAALVPLLAACNAWEQLGHGPDNTRFNPDEAAITPDNVDSLDEAWSAHVDGSFSEPILSGGKLYTTVVSAGIGSVRSYNADTGALIWTRRLPAPATPGSPGPVVLAGGALWVSYSGSGASFCSSRLTRLDPATGNVLSTETTDPADLGPVVADGTTVAFTVRGNCQLGNQPQLVVRDTGTTTGSWTYRFPAGVTPTAPSIGHGSIVVAAEDVVYAFDAAGCGAAICAPTWTTSLDPDGTGVWAYEGRPVIGPDGTVYIGADTSATETLVLALDGETGAHLWRTDLHPGGGSGFQGIALADGRLYVSDQRYSSGSGSGSGGAVEAFVAAGCGQPVCAPVWSAAVDRLPVAGLTVGGDVVYLGLYDEDDSRFVAFDADGCGAAVCSRLADVGFGDEQPLRVAMAGGRVAVVGAGPTGETLRVLVPSA